MMKGKLKVIWGKISGLFGSDRKVDYEIHDASEGPETAPDHQTQIGVLAMKHTPKMGKFGDTIKVDMTGLEPCISIVKHPGPITEEEVIWYSENVMCFADFERLKNEEE